MSEQVNMAARYEHEIPEGYEARIEGNKVIIELKESEDERMINEIIHTVTGYHPIHTTEEIDSMVAYLEKQKEQKPAEWSKEDERRLNWVIKHFSQSGEFYHDLIVWFKSLPERFNLQSKQEWSEEDSRILYNVIAYVGYAAGQRGVRDDEFKEANSWLKSLRPRLSDEEIKKIRSEEYTKGFNDAAFGSKQEWSEEDEKILDFWLDVIDRNDWRMDENFCKASREFINRLKSIRPQQKQDGVWITKEQFEQIKSASYLTGKLDHWKPSEEQIWALERAITTCERIGGDQSRLKALCEQLKLM